MIDCQRIEVDNRTIGGLEGARGEKIAALFEHPKIPFISYPYEWVFSQLKDAALAHLDLQLAAFEQGFVLNDATAFNMQFLHGRPVHIDHMSLSRYREGQVWAGYNQFCRQFLLPLLIEAWSGVSFQSIYRGSLDGISFDDALGILPRHRMFSSPSAMIHVYLHAKAIRNSARSQEKPINPTKLSPKNYQALLQQLRDFISGLQSSRRRASLWDKYDGSNTYTESMRSEKVAVVKDWASRFKPPMVIDICGNTGDYSNTALEGGASSVVLIDNDAASLEKAYRVYRNSDKPVLPLLMNVLDPSPNMGWRQIERQGLASRAAADGVIALAAIHHLVIGGNLPMADVLRWIMEMAPTGVIEFVPKQDPMVAGLLSAREDIFSDYTEDLFRKTISQNGEIVSEHFFEENGRLLVAYKTR